nr:MAG TPA: hypothetical protein [Caudoviricetes sp.]
MIPVDFGHLDTSTTAGQIVSIVLALTVLLSVLRQRIKFQVNKPGFKSYKSLEKELVQLKQASEELEETNRYFVRWQRVASELIRVLRNSLAASAIEENPRVQRLVQMLDDLDEEITKGILDDGEDYKPSTLE